jgi:DNA modification methylase
MNNKDEPFYRWYPFVEGFSGSLVKSIIEELAYTPTFCLDPFAGSGTTPLACQELGIKCLSYEVNPFLYDLTITKLYRRYDQRFIEKAINRMEQSLSKRKERWGYPELESQTLFEKKGREKWIFNRPVAWGLFDILDEIEKLPDEAGIYCKLLLKVSLASILLEVSNVFRNGKCLSYRPNWERNGTSRKDVHKKFIGFCREVILADLERIKAEEIIIENQPFCINGDARKLIRDLKDESLDLVITSPPYLNSRDYTDIYRLELWILGYLKSYAEQIELRKSTLRSHVQIAWPHIEETFKNNRLEKVIKQLAKNRESLWNSSIPEMIKGYFTDMNEILKSLYAKLRKNSKVYIIVGNSSYQKLSIETDFILAEIAQMNKFGLNEIRVARYLKSSGQQSSKKLRESIIVLTKT